jgi:hypothetical protein
VIAFTLDYYEQEAVLAYKISEEVIFKKSGLKNSS